MKIFDRFKNQTYCEGCGHHSSTNNITQIVSFDQKTGKNLSFSNMFVNYVKEPKLKWFQIQRLKLKD